MSDLPERDQRVSWHPYTQHALEGPPLPVVAAQGAWLELADGSRVIDGISSWWATLHGHSEPQLVHAMSEQAQRLDHVLFAGATHEPAVQLAERLLAVAPPGLSRVFYSDDGSTAVEVAIKMVLHAWVHRKQPQRRILVALEGAFHGDTFGAMAAGDPTPFFEPYSPMLFEVRRVPVDAQALADALEDLGDQAAGFVMEPLLQGAAGMRVMTSAFVRSARQLCDDHGIPMIADEVMTGFGRTGALFACERAGITPDVMCLAKGLTGGMLPLAATIATEELFETFLHDDRSQFFPHGHTFTANPIACAVALKSLELVLENRVPETLEAVGSSIYEQLSDLIDHPRVLNLRHLGGMVAFDLATTGEDAGYHSGMTPRLREVAIQRGVLLRPLGNVVYALPPACLSEAQATSVASVMRQLIEVEPD
jgi:adenosylmethionine---8-amino-7-oxononanoate aminotransferase